MHDMVHRKAITIKVKDVNIKTKYVIMMLDKKLVA